jgi:hypothetical protein
MPSSRSRYRECWFDLLQACFMSRLKKNLLKWYVGAF